MIEFGIAKIRALKMTWPPSGTEFAGMCYPDANDLGLPSLTAAYQGVLDIRHKKTFTPDPFVYAMYRKLCTKFWELDRLPVAQHKKAITSAHQSVVNHVLAGNQLPDVPNLVDDQNKEARRYLSKDAGLKQFDLIRKGLGMGERK